MAWSVTAVAATAPAAQSSLTTDKDKVSYAIGMQIGGNIAKSLEPVKGEVDVNVVLRAIGTVVNGGKPQMTLPDAQATLQAFGKKVQARQQAQQQVVGQKNTSEGAAFLAANAKKPGVKTTASGLEYQVLKEGVGPKPKASDSVKVNYTGQLLDGTTFDASSQHGGPAVLQLSGVIPGWTEGLQLMSPGSKYVFWIPGKLAYGDHGTPGGPIGPNATLKFEVELLSIGDK
ncbi:MAG TPA: FKBP-type peptidyl-prolyl cis-trans isomerase [Xanthomonadaceae bacterium]|nr:FKBP-type peptidyl-prolyl cis-trans isomerase [Xanthomonadaceae bacterium]